MARKSKISRLTITDAMIVAAMRKAHRERSHAFAGMLGALGQGLSRVFSSGKPGRSAGIPHPT